jgi:CheY-like chemotaxis protein
MHLTAHVFYTGKEFVFIRERLMHFDHTILIVDDDNDDLEMLNEAFKEHASKCRVEFAYDGEQALERLEQLQQQGALPCLIVLDVNMPKLNGVATLQSIRATELTKDIPVVIFSTASERGAKGFYTPHNARYFQKPVSYKGVVDVVKEFLNICQQGRET